MNPALVADTIVDLCGALGVGVAILTLRRRDPHGALTARFLPALGLVAALFTLRGLGGWSGSALLQRSALVYASLFPLAALIVAEGTLRRHAPRWLKLAVLAGALLLALASLAGLPNHVLLYGSLLAAFQIATFASLGLLLFIRDRTSLTAAENDGVWRLGWGAFLVLPFILSDFRGLWPDMPVRLGGLGALLIVSLMLVTGGSTRTRRQGFALMVLRLVGAMALGLGAAFLMANPDLADMARMVAIALAGVLAIGLMVDALNGAFEQSTPGMLASLARSGAMGREALVAQLTEHPLFENAARLREVDLADYDPPVLRAALSDVAVLRAADRPWGRKLDAPDYQRLAALLATHSASHLLVLGRDPLDLILLTVPVVSADPATETALVLIRRLLADAPREAA